MKRTPAFVAAAALVAIQSSAFAVNGDTLKFVPC